MNNENKPVIRITIERVSITTIRTRASKVYCDVCLRSLHAEDPDLTPERRKDIHDAVTATVAEDDKGEMK